MSARSDLRPKLSKTCDECKGRKETTQSARAHAFNKRGTRCQFSLNKRWVKQSTRFEAPQENEIRPAGESMHMSQSTNSLDDDEIAASREGITSAIDAATPLGLQCPSELSPGTPYIDYLLAGRGRGGRRRNENSLVEANDCHCTPSPSPDPLRRRIALISDRLGHTRFKDNIERIASLIHSRMNYFALSSPAQFSFRETSSSPRFIAPETSLLDVDAYFRHVHPLWPFLDRASFEEKVFSPHANDLLRCSPAFSALYHAVIALGSLHRGGGHFNPGHGPAWTRFRIALGLIPELLYPRERLLNVQAITAVAIFAQSLSSIQIGNMMVTEAARMVQQLSLNKAVYHNENEAECGRTFWVIYVLEKLQAFVCGRTSVLLDHDIGTPIPETPDAMFGEFDWFLTMIRLCRILSKASDSIFSISATLRPTMSAQAAVQAMYNELEDWRQSIPAPFRPGTPLEPTSFLDQKSLMVALWVRLYHCCAVVALSRISLHLKHGHERWYAESKMALMTAAREVIEMTRYIDAKPYVPAWVLFVMPLSALFILFDFVVHNPKHPETTRNLSLLGVAAGYYCRLEYASGGIVTSSPFTEFVDMATQYVRNVNDVESEESMTAGLSQNVRQPSTSALAQNCDQSTAAGSTSDWDPPSPKDPRCSTLAYVQDLDMANDEYSNVLTSNDLYYPLNDLFPHPDDWLPGGVGTSEFQGNFMLNLPHDL